MPATPLDVPGRIYQPDPNPSSIVKLSPFSNVEAQDPGSKLTSASGDTAGPSSPIVTQESYARLGMNDIAAVETLDGVGPPKIGSW